MLSLYPVKDEARGGTRLAWGYVLDAAYETDDPGAEDDGPRLADLSPARRRPPEDMTALQWAAWLNNAAPPNVPDAMHPSMDAIVPWSAAKEYMATILSGLPFPIDPSVRLLTTVSMIPLGLGARRLPLFGWTDEELAVMFCVHPYVHASESEKVLSKLRLANDLAFEMGGKRYLNGWLPFEEAHWRSQLGASLATLRALKEKHDPQRILNPGFCPLL
jgi:FAD/FMN-containing dehydrogenase